MTAWIESELNKLRDTAKQKVREWIVETAISRGGFSIWFTVLGDDEDMRLRLINAFIGTATNCFDQNGLSIHRPGGMI